MPRVRKVVSEAHDKEHVGMHAKRPLRNVVVPEKKRIRGSLGISSKSSVKVFFTKQIFRKSLLATARRTLSMDLQSGLEMTLSP